MIVEKILEEKKQTASDPWGNHSRETMVSNILSRMEKESDFPRDSQRFSMLRVIITKSTTRLYKNTRVSI